MKIGVFGDSFAAEVGGSKYLENESWVNYIRNKGYEIISHGMTGTSSFHSFKKFLEFNDDYTHIVFCWSFVHRIPYMPDKYKSLSFCYDPHHFISSGTAERWFQVYTPDEQEEIKLILSAAHISRDDFLNLWIQQKLFEDVNNLCREKNKKLINIFSFLNDNDPYNNLNWSKKFGDVFYNLTSVSHKELKLDLRDIRYCHLSKENNEVLGNLILDRFSKNDSITINLFKEIDFIYSKEIADRYTKISTFK